MKALAPLARMVRNLVRIDENTQVHESTKSYLVAVLVERMTSVSWRKDLMKALETAEWVTPKDRVAIEVLLDCVAAAPREVNRINDMPWRA